MNRWHGSVLRCSAQIFVSFQTMLRVAEVIPLRAVPGVQPAGLSKRLQRAPAIRLSASSIRSTATAICFLGAAVTRRRPRTFARVAVAMAVPENLEALLFDIDGTLADTDPVHFSAFVDILREVGFNDGIAIDEDFFKSRISGRQNKQICGDLFPDWDQQRAEAFAEKKEAMFRDSAAKLLKPMAGLDRVRAWCEESGLKKIAVTNAPRVNAEFIMDCIGYRSWFPELVIGDECERGKPDPCPYETAMKRLGVRPECCIAFEDSPSGAKSAVAAGVYTVGILSSQDPEKLRAAGCAEVVQSFDDEHLWQLLRKVKLPRSGQADS
eukprot:s1344_g19.t1